MKRMISIDPSSSVTGWAVWENGELINHGRLRCPRYDLLIDRMSKIHELMRVILKQHRVECAVIEEPGVHLQRRHRGTGKVMKGLPIYGMAAGVILMTCVDTMGWENIRMFEPNVWTRKLKKEVRNAYVKDKFPSYTGEGDSGCDESDAIALGDWYHTEMYIAGAGQ